VELSLSNRGAKPQVPSGKGGRKSPKTCTRDIDFDNLNAAARFSLSLVRMRSFCGEYEERTALGSAQHASVGLGRHLYAVGHLATFANAQNLAAPW